MEPTPFKRCFRRSAATATKRTTTRDEPIDSASPASTVIKNKNDTNVDLHTKFHTYTIDVAGQFATDIPGSNAYVFGAAEFAYALGTTQVDRPRLRTRREQRQHQLLRRRRPLRYRPHGPTE